MPRRGRSTQSSVRRSSRTNVKTKALYKLGWCQAQAADYAGAIKTYTQYIEKNAGNPTLPSAIAQRGLAYQQNRDYERRAEGF